MKRENVLRDRKTIILGALILLLVVVNVRQWGPATGVLPGAGQESTRENNQISEQDPLLSANLLSAPKAEFREEKRNIFSFADQGPGQQPSQEEEAAAAAEAAPPAAVCGNSVCESGEDETNCPTDCQPPPPPPPVVNLRYIGFMSDPNGSVAFLTDGKEVYMARVNEVVANQYRVIKITEESVELGLLNNNQSSTIRFQGNQGG